MKILRRFLLLSFLAAVWTGARGDEALGSRLIGTWREYSPADNLVRFSKTGAWKLYLKKGEMGGLRSLDGRWSVSEQEGTLSVVMVLSGKEKPMPPARITFEGEDMILTEIDGNKTRHRRHKGPLPKEFRW